MNNSKENYILKIKEELDNLSNRRQNMFNVSIVVMTALIITIIWKINTIDVGSEKVLSDIESIKQVELGYIIIVLIFITFFIMLLTQHKYIAKVKYKVLDDLIDETRLYHYRYEYDLLKPKYINNNWFLKISHIEVLILYVFAVIPFIILCIFNNRFNCSNRLIVLLYFVFMIIHISIHYTYKLEKKKY